MLTEEYVAEFGHEPEGNDLTYLRFLRPATVRGNVRVAVGYAWDELPSSFCSEDIPEGEKWSTSTPEHPQCLENYTLNYQQSNDGTKGIFTMSARNAIADPVNKTRKPYTDSDALAVWDEHFTAQDRGSHLWMDVEERNALLLTPAYAPIEVAEPEED